MWSLQDSVYQSQKSIMCIRLLFRASVNFNGKIIYTQIRIKNNFSQFTLKDNNLCFKKVEKGNNSCPNNVKNDNTNLYRKVDKKK